MQVVLTLSKDIDSSVAELILNGKLEGGYSIDYALNSLVSFLDGKEVVIYNFDKYLKLDNRWGGYKIDNYGTKIVINFN
jgi:hypothetical protein